MDINFGRTIAQKLGLTQDLDLEADQASMLSLAARHDAAREAGRIGLAKGRQGRRGVTERPTGYGRRIRRIRNQDQESAQRKQRKAAFNRQREREAFYDHAAQLARIYFELIPVRPEVRKRILDRADQQARRLQKTEKISFDEALVQVEKAMLDNLSEFEKLQASKIQAKLKAAKQAQIDALKMTSRQWASNSKLDPRTGHPVVG